MPELPEVETIMLGLRPVWEGDRFQEIIINRPDLRRPFPKNMKEILEGARILHLYRRAKYILCNIESPVPSSEKSRKWTLLLHLGMSGRLLIESQNHDISPRKHEHLVFVTENGNRVGFVDPRRFGMADLVPTDRLQDFSAFTALGIEPLDQEQFTLKNFQKALSCHSSNVKTTIKSALLDQKRLVGLGNIYVCEVLFRAGISPLKPVSQLSGRDMEVLWKIIPKILLEALAAGGSTLRDYVNADGEKGNFQLLHQVYGREGQPCPDCVGHHGKDKPYQKSCPGIQRIVQNGRSSFFCPQKQTER